MANIVSFMFYMKFLAYALLCNGSPVYSDIVDYGRTFVFAIPQFYNNPEGLLATLVVMGRSHNTSQVKVHIDEIDFAEYIVASNQEASTIYLPRSAVGDTGNGHASTVRVSSSNDVSLRCIVGYQYTGRYPGEGFLVLPIASLDKKYIIVTGSSPSELLDPYKGESYHALFTVSAAYDNTVFEIEPNVPLNVSQKSHNTSEVIRMTLNKHKSILVSSFSNLSGTRVAANRPIAVVSGNDCGAIPGAKPFKSCYFMIEQLLPVSSWGCQFEVSPFQVDTTTHVLHFTAQDKDTRVTVHDDIKRVLVPDDNNMSFTQHLSGFQVVHIVSNRPIMVAHFIEMVVPLGISGAMTIVPSVREFVGQAVIAMPVPRQYYASNESNIPDLSVCIVVNCSLLETIRLNGNPLNLQSGTVHQLCGHYCSVDQRIYAHTGQIISITSTFPLTRMSVTAKAYHEGLLDFVFPASLGTGWNAADDDEGMVVSTSQGVPDIDTKKSCKADENGYHVFWIVGYACAGFVGMVCTVAIIVVLSRKWFSKRRVNCRCHRSPDTNQSVTDYDDFNLDKLSWHRYPSSMCSSTGTTFESHRTSPIHYQPMPV